PTSLGLVHYDLLEETAFLGLGHGRAKGGLAVAPEPWREAKIALSFDGAGFVARALPGEPPPDVNGAPAEAARLKDGDRIRLGDLLVLVAAWRALDHLQTPGEGLTPSLPPPSTTEAVVPRETEKLEREIASVEDFERRNPQDLPGAADRWAAFVRDHVGTPQA